MREAREKEIGERYDKEENEGEITPDDFGDAGADLTDRNDSDDERPERPEDMEDEVENTAKFNNINNKNSKTVSQLMEKFSSIMDDK